MEQLKAYFVVDASWDESRIAKIFVERETDKTYFIHHAEKLLGWQYIGKRISKDKNVFPNFSLAIECLISKREASIKRHQENLAKAEKDLSFLIDLKNAIKE